MPKQPARKSRAGCITCKRRHRKCDETHPVCMLCQVAGLKCSFNDIAAPRVTTASSLRRPNLLPHPAGLEWRPEQSSSRENTPSSRTNNADLVGSDAGSPQTPTPTTSDSSTLLRLQLLNHVLSPNVPDFVGDLKSRHKTTTFAIRVGTSHPYVLELVLSLTADHYRIACASDADEAAQYHDHARNFRDDALVSFNFRTASTDPDGIAAALIFSSLMGVSLVCDLAHSESHRTDISVFFERFGAYLQVSRGVQTLALQGPKHAGQCHKHEFESFVTNAAQRFMAGSRMSQHECAPILELLASCGIDQEVRELYEASINALQRSFDAGKAPAATEYENWSDILAWPVTAPVGFAEKVAERDTLALVILAYFGVLLHRYRRVWAFGDLGAFTVKSVRDVLGNGFDSWLSLPIHEVL